MMRRIADDIASSISSSSYQLLPTLGVIRARPRSNGAAQTQTNIATDLDCRSGHDRARAAQSAVFPQDVGPDAAGTMLGQQQA
jgi:hypothetical protein